QRASTLAEHLEHGRDWDDIAWPNRLSVSARYGDASYGVSAGVVRSGGLVASAATATARDDEQRETRTQRNRAPNPGALATAVAMQADGAASAIDGANLLLSRDRRKEMSGDRGHGCVQLAVRLIGHSIIRYSVIRLFGYSVIRLPFLLTSRGASAIVL